MEREDDVNAGPDCHYEEAAEPSSVLGPPWVTFVVCPTPLAVFGSHQRFFIASMLNQQWNQAERDIPLIGCSANRVRAQEEKLK